MSANALFPEVTQQGLFLCRVEHYSALGWVHSQHAVMFSLFVSGNHTQQIVFLNSKVKFSVSWFEICNMLDWKHKHMCAFTVSLPGYIILSSYLSALPRSKVRVTLNIQFVFSHTNTDRKFSGRGLLYWVAFVCPYPVEVISQSLYCLLMSR